MKPRLVGALVALTVFLALFCLFPEGSSANYTVTYQLLDRVDGFTHYRLNVVVSESLHQYYVEKDHGLITENDFAKFVTPYALKPVSDSLRQLYDDDEAFVNGVLMIVHQITYEVTGPPKYPAETIVDGKGDCDLFSYIAASIIKAGGLDVVLFYYESESHMNVGVNLSQDPVEARSSVEYVVHGGKKFYVAECTGEDWQKGWRVGECPDNLKQVSLQVITLEDCEHSAPGQVTASFKTLQPSLLSLTVSTSYLLQGGAVTLSGQLSPVMPNASVTIYIKVNGLPWSELVTIETDFNGHFSYVWNAATAGICSVRASWSGDETYAAADSPVHTITVLSLFFVSLLSITIVLVCIGITIFMLSRRANYTVSEPEPPEIPP
jgi:hypothetical protein